MNGNGRCVVYVIQYILAAVTKPIGDSGMCMIHSHKLNGQTEETGTGTRSTLTWCKMQSKWREAKIRNQHNNFCAMPEDCCKVSFLIAKGEVKLKKKCENVKCSCKRQTARARLVS